MVLFPFSLLLLCCSFCIGRCVSYTRVCSVLGFVHDCIPVVFDELCYLDRDEGVEWNRKRMGNDVEWDGRTKTEPQAMYCRTEFNPKRKTLSLPTMMTHTCRISRPPLADAIALTIESKRSVNPCFSYHGIRVGLVPNIECP